MTRMGTCILLGAIVGFGIISTRAEVMDSDTETKIRSFVSATMDCRKIPGLTLAIVKDNDTWTEGFGTADFDTGRNVTSKSLFGIGSVTKAFTMTLLAILLDENGFTWSSKVSDVIGSEFKFIDDIRTKETTLRDLLSHRTGLASLDIGFMAGYQRNETDRANLSQRSRFIPAAHEFRDRFLYNNYMYSVLGYIAEILGKDSWENLIPERLLKPIGMTSTTIMLGPQDVQKTMSAKPYIYKEGKFQDGNIDIYEFHIVDTDKWDNSEVAYSYSIYPIEPAGAILSTAEDMAKWIKFNMENGKTENNIQLVKETMLKEARQAITPVYLPSEPPLNRPTFPIADINQGYGYAWFTSTYRGFERYWHSGGLFSYITYLWIFPEIKLGLFTSVNGPAFKSGPALRSILYYTSDKLLEEEPWLNETTTCTFPEPWKDVPSKNSSMEETGDLPNADEYSGVFGNEFLPDLTISVPKDNEKSLRLDSHRLSGMLYPTLDKDRFLLEFTSPWEFAQDLIDDSNVTALTNVTFIRTGGLVTDARFSFDANVTFSKGISLTDPIHKTTSGALSLWGLRAWVYICLICTKLSVR